MRQFSPQLSNDCFFYMSAIGNIYIIIFLPLICSVFCQLFIQRTVAFAIAFMSSLMVLLLSGKALFDVLTFQNLANDFNLSHVSLALEFNINSLSLTFLLLTLFIKLVNLFYYRRDIQLLLSSQNDQNFYSVFLVNIFSLIGIFSSNNLINLFIFLEIYAFTFFAISSIANNVEIAKSSFKYFCFSAASSLIILLCFLAIYFVLGDLRFEQVHQDLPLIEDKTFIKALLFLLFGAFLFKFLPFIFYIKNIKNSENFSNFFITDSLLIKLNMAIFLFLKFSYCIFADLELSPIFNFQACAIVLSFVLALYASFKVYQQTNLRVIAIYFCLSNVAFIIACIALRSIESMQALFFFMCHLCLVNFAILIFASFLQKTFHNSNLNQIAKIKDQLLLILPFKLLLFFILAFPLTILFFANWYLAYAVLKPAPEAILLVALIVANLAQLRFIANVLNIFYQKQAEDDIISFELTATQTITGWLLVVVLYASIFALAAMGKLSLNFASAVLG